MSERGKKIALVGTCPSSRMLAPFRDGLTEIWACSPDNAGGVLPRIDRFFEIHGDLGFADGEPWEPSYIEWINAHSSGPNSFDLVVNPALAGSLFPRAEALPKEELIRRFGMMFFTSTPAWMMACAIVLGVKSIGLYGLDMSAKSEYFQQRPGMQHFIALAVAMGIEVTCPAESDLMQPTPLYGFSLSSPFGRKMEVRRKEVAARVAELDRTIQQATLDRASLAGALDDIDYVQTIWTGEQSPSALGMERNVKTDPKVVNLKET